MNRTIRGQQVPLNQAAQQQQQQQQPLTPMTPYVNKICIYFFLLLLIFIFILGDQIQ